jgi:hypothetical protein
MVSKLQLRMPEVTSWRQYAPAAAGVEIETNAIASKAAAGAADIFKSCFMFLSRSLCLCSVLIFSPESDMGWRGTGRHRLRKKAKEFSVEPCNRSKRA